MVLDKWALLSVISVDILLAKAFHILVFCVVVRNSSWVNSSLWKFFYAILNVFLFLFLAADFNSFSCVFVSLTLASSQFAIFYNAVTLLREILVLFLWFFLKEAWIKTNMDCVASAFTRSIYFLLFNKFYLRNYFLISI